MPDAGREVLEAGGGKGCRERWREGRKGPNEGRGEGRGGVEGWKRTVEGKDADG